MRCVACGDTSNGEDAMCRLWRHKQRRKCDVSLVETQATAKMRCVACGDTSNGENVVCEEKKQQLRE